MMASRVLSRLLPVAEGDVSVYEGLRRDAAEASADVEARSRGPSGPAFHDEDDDDDDPERLLYDHELDANPTHGASVMSPQARPSSGKSPELGRRGTNWLEEQGRQQHVEDEDVPESLLLERKGKAPIRPSLAPESTESKLRKAEAQWRAVQGQRGFRNMSIGPSQPDGYGHAQKRPVSTQTQPDLYAEAMWLYTNVSNLDAFLLEVYQYFVGHGVWSILLSRIISLATELFVFSLAMFLSTCVDYSKIPSSKKTSEVVIPQCMSQASWFKNAFMFCFIIYWCSTAVRYGSDARKLFRMHDFYLHVLGISDADIQTVSWVRVVDGLIKVQNANIATATQTQRNKGYLKYGRAAQRLTAESVANRLMRKDNYYVALYNKDLLDFTLPLPYLGSRHFYSKNLEWCIDFCLTNFIFDEQGNIRPFCLDVRNRANLVKALRFRLHIAAAASVILAPFNVLRFCLLYFFRYYTEFTRNPASASARSWTPYAEWKIRQFNELDHLFQRRLRQAAPFANEYLKQFPKDKTDQACRFIAFISGAIAAVLAVATLFDPELFLGFEVTPGRTAVFWFTVMIGIFGVAQGSVPDENEVHDPVLHLREVIMYTHHVPSHWKGRLHSNEVRSEFSALYQMKILIFSEEILSLFLAPWILLRNTGKQAERLIDFFREQTVHVEGVGHQCNFAVFGFKKDLNAEDPAIVLNEPDGLRDDYYGLKDDKMQASVQNFRQYYSQHHQVMRRGGQTWQPPPAWPPLLSPPGVGEGREWPNPADTGHGHSLRSAGLRQSGLVDRHSTSFSRRTGPTSGQTGRERGSVLHEPSKARTNISNTVQGLSESKLMAQDSELQEYADADKGALESDTEGEDGVDQSGGRTAGVLGMLYQFSKAQTEKGTGVNI